MASWLQNQLRAAEGLLEAVDRTAKVTREHAGAVNGPGVVGLPWGPSHSNQEPRADSSAAASSTQSSLSNDTDQKPKLVMQGSGTITTKKAKSGEKKKTIKTGRMSRTSSVTGSNSSSRAGTPTASKAEAKTVTAAPPESRSYAAPPQTSRLSDTGLQDEASPGHKPMPPALQEADVAVMAGEAPQTRIAAQDRSREAADRSHAPQGAVPDNMLITSVSPQGDSLIETPLLSDPVREEEAPSVAVLPPAAPRPSPFAAVDAAVTGDGSRWQTVESHEAPCELPNDDGDDSATELLRLGAPGPGGVSTEDRDEEPAEEAAKAAENGETESGAEEEWVPKGRAEEAPGVADPVPYPAAEEEEQEEEEEGEAPSPSSSSAEPTQVGGAEGGMPGALPPRLGQQPGSASMLRHELEEARELAQVAVSSGSSSREVRLQRVCDKLRVRLEELKEENHQLEELLHQADAKASGGMGEADRLKAELKKAKAESATAISSLETALCDRDAQLEKASEEAQKRKSQVEVLERKLESLQETSESLLRERQNSEGRLMAALRDQLSEVEGRLDEERAAHNLTRKAGAARQEQLEADLAEAASEYSALQRVLDDRNAKVDDLEAHVLMAEEEHERLQADLRRAEETAAREKARADANSNDALEAQVVAWKEEAEKARKNLHNAEDELEESKSAQEKLTKTVKELEAVVKNARGAADSDLAQRFKEVTDLLYLKQTQLEKMAADKAAQQLSMEREICGLREDLDKAKRRAAAARDPMESYGNDMQPMDRLGAAYQRLANHAQIGGAIKGFTKAVDMTAANAMSIMREYPLARVLFFLYSILIHLFVYILIQRLQNRYLLNDESSSSPGMMDG